jgi:hypothetical protein
VRPAPTSRLNGIHNPKVAGSNQVAATNSIDTFSIDTLQAAAFGRLLHLWHICGRGRFRAARWLDRAKFAGMPIQPGRSSMLLKQLIEVHVMRLTMCTKNNRILP